MAEIKELRSPQGQLLAHAAVKDNYLSGAALYNQIQHEKVPFFVTAFAIDQARKVMIYGLTDEMFTTYKDPLLKMTIKAVPNAILTSVRDFIEPEEYLFQFASALSQMKLTPVAQSDLPSIIGQNIQASYANFMNEYQSYFDIENQLGTPTYPNNSLMKSILVKYKAAAADGSPVTVLAGMDYKGIEYYTSASPTAIFGGLLGVLTKKKEPEGGSNRLGHGSPCSAIDWGAANKFLMVAPDEYVDEATVDFLEFVASFHMDDALRQQFYLRNAERSQMMINQAQQLQQMAHQSALNLQASQRRLAQTLAENSAAMSAGIMDSWNKKMASDSRISQARSEAIRGVDVYTNSYGQNVDVSVSSDHVYQNQYGDVYGVSGNALDNELLSKLNWTELNK